MKRTIKKMISFSTAVAALMNVSLMSVYAGYDVKSVADCNYDELIQMRDKSILIENGTDYAVGNETELIVIDENGNKNVISKDLGIHSIYNYVSTTMGVYNYISPTSASYSFDFFDQSYRISTEQDAVIVGIDDKYALMNNDGEIVSEKYNNIYYSGDGYFVVDNAAPDSVYDYSTGSYTENKSGLIKADGTVVVEPTDGVIGYYITPDGGHFMADTETGDYFIDSTGTVVSEVFDEVSVNGDYDGMPKYAKEYACTLDCYKVSLNGKYALMNQKMQIFTDYYDEIIRDTEYNYETDTYEYCYDGYFVTLDGKKAFIDLEGNKITDFYDDIKRDTEYNYETHTYEYVYDGYIVTLDGKMAFVDLAGNKLTDFYDELNYLENSWFYRDGFNIAVLDKDFNVIGSIDMTDKIAEDETLYSFDVIPDFNDTLSVSVTVNEATVDEWGWNTSRIYQYIINQNGNILDISDYESFMILANSNILVRDKADSSIKLIDNQGNVITTFDEDYNSMRLFNTDERTAFILSTDSEFSVYDDSGNILYERIEGYCPGNSDNIFSRPVYDETTGEYTYKEGIITLESGVVLEPVYNNITVYGDWYNWTAEDRDSNLFVYIVETDDAVKILSKDFEELYSLDAGYKFEGVTKSEYYVKARNSRITFNNANSETGETSTIVYNYEKNIVEYQQTGLYDYVSEFLNGYAVVYKYSDSDTESDDLWTSQNNAEKAIIDITGKEIVPFGFRVSIDPEYISVNGVYISYEELESGKDFSNTYGYNIAVKQNENVYKVFSEGKWGLVSAENELILDIKYDDISAFTDGLAMITSGKYCGIVTIDGKILADPVYTDYKYADHSLKFEDGTAYLRDLIEETDFNGFSYKDLKGTEIVNDFCRTYGYDLARKEGDFYYVEKDGKAGIVTADNEIVIPVEYKDILSFNSTKYSLEHVQERFHDILTDEYTSKLKITDNGTYLAYVRDDSGKIGLAVNLKILVIL